VTDEVVFPGKMSIFWEEFLMTMPRIPESEIRTLEPLPRMVRNMLLVDEFRSLGVEKLSTAAISARYFKIVLN